MYVGCECDLFCLSVCLCVRVCVFLYLSLFLSIHLPSLNLSIYPSVCLSVSLFPNTCQHLRYILFSIKSQIRYKRIQSTASFDYGIPRIKPEEKDESKHVLRLEVNDKLTQKRLKIVFSGYLFFLQ
jgi:hypothetical protein